MEDTIVAISTPLGVSGIGIVRLSGDKAISIAEKIFFPRNKKKIVSQLPTFTVHLGYIIDNGEILDEVLMTIMRKPHSYTCEDVVEFSCHGGPVILKRVVELCISLGARLAEPGEFTKRAFLNGRIDLSQAEAVCELINAKTLLQNRLATYSLLGGVRKNIENIVEEFKNLMAEVELLLDFSDEDDTTKVDLELVVKKTKYLKEKILEMVNNSERIVPISIGVNVAIVGKTNVGKSSLLNILLNYERAIVSEIPGTTRDTVSETINFYNVPLKIIDTAGIREHSQDVIEKIGMERTKRSVEEADIILFMLDASRKVDYEDQLVVNIIIDVIKEKFSKKIVIPILNKIDLCNEEQLNSLTTDLDKFFYQFSNFPEIKVTKLVQISCKTRVGMDKLEQMIISCLGLENSLEKSFSQDTEPSMFVSNLRQLEILKSVYNEVNNALNLDIKKNLELFCEHVRLATKELMKITGGELTEDVLNLIFSKFCIGK